MLLPGRGGRIAGASSPTNIEPVEVMLFEKHINTFNLFLLGGAEESARWLNTVQKLAERTRLGIPALISSDPRHSAAAGGVASFRTEGFSAWPSPLGLAALRDPRLVQRFAEAVAREYRAIGIHMGLHPTADLATEPRWARISQTFGEDAQLSAELVRAYVRGLQGETLGPKGVAAVTKHFAGGGPQKDGLDPHFRMGKDQIYPGDNLDHHLIPFKAAIEAGTEAIMPYYGVPVGQTSEDVAFGFNWEMLTDLLRDRMGFEGLLLSDWTLLTATSILGVPLERLVGFLGPKNYGVEHLDPPHRAGKALDAGIDQFGGESRPDYVLQLLREGTVSQERLDTSVRRILTLKFQLGLFDDPYVDAAAAKSTLASGSAAADGALAQRRSQVLLVNRPADEARGRRPILPIAEGTRIFVKGFRRSLASRYGELVRDLDDAEIAIVNMKPPFDPRYGSFFRQGRLYWTPEQLEPVLAIARRKPTIVTFELERPYLVAEIAREAKAVLANFSVSPEAVLDVLFGRDEPCGELPFDMPSNWASVLRQKPDVPFDLEDPLFRFGHGLRYADSVTTSTAKPG